MSNFEKAREAMVVSQLQPAGIMSEAVIEAYRAVKREDFLPENLKAVCYLDESLPLADGTKVLEPLLHAIMVDELDIKRGEKVLDIGDSTGYSAAILEHLGATVAKEAVDAPFDAIIINGAVGEIPEDVLNKLTTGGRLAAIVVPKGKAMGKIVVATKESSGAVAKQVFEDATAAYIRGYEPKAEFVF